MIGYNVMLKSIDTIKGLCFEVGGKYSNDGIAFNEDLIKNKFSGISKLTAAYEYSEGLVAYKITNTIGESIFIHLSWLLSVNGEITLHPIIEHANSPYLKVTATMFLEKGTGKLIPIADIPSCACGGVVAHTMDDGVKLCGSCFDKLTVLNSYSYKPTPVFIGTQLHNDKNNEVWYGLEIEISTDKKKLAPFIHKHKGAVYLKSDGSIRGDNYNVEVVSHPFSFSELMKGGSWLEDIGHLPTNTSNRNGVHIHISRTAFVDDRHYSLFYFLMHKMVDICTKVGGRELTEYCSLSPSGKVHTKTKGSLGNGDRRLFINETNSSTIEARFFQGTTNTTKLKAYVQLLESLIKYTRYHKVKVSSDKWFQYISQKPNKYKELLEVLGSYNISGHTVVYREPIYRKVQPKNLMIADTRKISKYIRTNGDEVVVTRFCSLSRDGNSIIVAAEAGDDFNISLNANGYFLIEDGLEEA